MRKIIDVENDIKHSEFDFRMEKLSVVVEMVKGLIDRYGEDAVFDIDTDCDGYATMTVTSKRFETDCEMNRRLEIEKIRSQSQNDRDRAEYERLKKLFESKSE